MSEKEQLSSEEVTRTIVRMLYLAQAARWPLRQKAQLTAAVKASLLPVEGNLEEES